MSWLFPAR
jgi:hypothetical protein